MVGPQALKIRGEANGKVIEDEVDDVVVEAEVEEAVLAL